MLTGKSSGRLILVGLLITALAFMAGCSSKSVADDVPAGSTVTVSASPAAVTNGATSVVEATVLTGTSGVANQIVTFTVLPNDAGYFTPAIDTTDANGVAASMFTATTSGNATVTATVAGGSSLAATAGITISQAAQSGTGNIDISVSPSLLLANSADTSQVTITVRDGDGNPAPDGTIIKITAGEMFVDMDGNGYWSAGFDSLVYDANGNGMWDAIGLIPSTAVTVGGIGSATVNYISGSNALTVYIKATVDDNSVSGNAETSVQLTPNASINSIYLASDSINLVVKTTGGVETAHLHATCLDGNGNPVPEGLSVSFVITDGPGGGEHLGNVGLGPLVAVTNSQGTASAPIHSGTVSGTVRIRAFADTVMSNATQIMISAGPPAYIVVGAEECNVPYWETVNERQKCVAVVADIYHNPVNDSTVVYFTTEEGTIMSHEKRTEGLQGIATTQWISGNYPGQPANGRVWIYAETAGGTVTDSSMFYNTWVATTLTISGAPSSLPAEPSGKASVTVTGVDLNGNPVTGGTTFEGDAKYLLVSGGTLEDGCAGSSGRAEIKSANLRADYSLAGGQDDGIGAYDTAWFWTKSGATAGIEIVMTTGVAYKLNCILTGQASALPGEVISMQVIIADRFANPLGDHSLTMTATAGVVTNPNQTTNMYGEANGFIWTAPDSGSATIIVTDNDPRGNLSLTKGIAVSSD